MARNFSQTIGFFQKGEEMYIFIIAKINSLFNSEVYKTYQKFFYFLLEIMNRKIEQFLIATWKIENQRIEKIERKK